MRLLFITLFIIFHYWNLSSQSTYLEDLNIYLIGPDNVNIHLQEQEAFYVAAYREILQASKEELMILQSEKTTLDNKKRLKKKEKKRLTELNYIEDIIEAEIRSLKTYIELWERYPMKLNNNTTAQKLLSDTCFELIGEKGVYSPKEYQVVTITDDFFVYWQEFIEVEVLEEEVVTTKWVKRKADKNCMSADPNDCLVWSLVEGTEKQINKTCPSIFSETAGKNLCARTISVENEHLSQKRIKAYTTTTHSEIAIVEVRKIACE